MLLIAHRGNTHTKRPNMENSPEYVLEALESGYDCEVDVWLVNNRWCLGHDGPVHSVPLQFLQMPGIWCDCKNLEALAELQYHRDTVVSVWNDLDKYPLTSNGYIWTHTDVAVPENLTMKSVAIMPEQHDWKCYETAYKLCAGVCSDTVSFYERD